MDASVSDHDLLNEARLGRREAIEALLARHEPQIYRFALRMCGNPEDAGDVLQETLLAAFKGLPEFRGDASLSTWLFQVARSYCIKAKRRRVGQPERMEALDPLDGGPVLASVAASPEERMESQEVGETLRAALGALPDHYREVLLLKDVEGLSAEEIGGIIDEKVPAVKSRLHRARLELRRMLDGVLGETREDCTPCPALAEELAGYAAGDIERSTCERMEAHMAACSRCARACEVLKKTVLLCSRVEGEEVPAPIRAAIRQSVPGYGRA